MRGDAVGQHREDRHSQRFGGLKGVKLYTAEWSGESRGWKLDDPWAYRRRGIAWTELKKWDQALEDFNEALRLGPGDGHTLLLRGDVWFFKKDHERAQKDYSEAIRLNPQYANAYQNRSAARKRMGNAAGSSEDAAQAQALLAK